MKQGIYEESATPKYPVGTRLAIGDRVFHYCRAVTALTEKWGARNTDTLHEVLDTAAALDAGATTITLVVADIAKDQFKDGYLNVWTTPAQVCLRIKGNDATVGANTTFYLKDPLLYDTPLATDCDLHANIYNNVGTLGGGEVHSSVVCIPLIPITINYYFWGQTWGPVIGVAHADGGQGAGADERSVWFWIDGSIGALTDVTSAGEQMAGFMLPDTTAGDDIFFMLQLAP